MTTDAQTPAPATTIPCQTCHQGTLERKKVYRLAGPAVVTGYLFFVPAILIMLICLSMGGCYVLVGGAMAASSGGLSSAEKQQLERAEVPQPIIAKISRGEAITAADREGLNQNQRMAISNVQLSNVAGKGFGGLMGVGGVLIAVVGFFGAAIWGLLGWLLIMKKWILRCTHCSAVVNAS